MRANLSGARLSGANLSLAELSGAIVDINTDRKNILGCQIGVNGIFCKDTDSAALMILTPPGNSMIDPNPEAIVKILDRSRRLHGYSLALVGIVLLIAVLSLREISFPFAKDLKITPPQFILLAMPISIALMSIVNTFLSEVLQSARYIIDRKSAMSVGNFPWALTKFSGAARAIPSSVIYPIKSLLYETQSLITKMQSLITRAVMSFHGTVYIYYAKKWDIFSPLAFWILSALIVIFSSWTFIISQRFQKPILFDSQTEKERKDNIEKLTETVKEQTSVMKELVDIIKPRGGDNSLISDSDDKESDGPKNE
jgi:hypothetical protein